ncbi:MAG: tetratricopeptide repeat protein, partial [Planctomycetota bacterium]
MLARAGQVPDAIGQFRRAMNLAMEESIASVRTVHQDVHSAMSMDEAITRFNVSPDDSTLGRANDRILFRLFQTAGRFPEAVSKIEQAIATARDPQERAGLLQEQGEMYQTAGDYAAARRAYEESLKIDDQNWVAMNNLAYLISEKMGEHAIALPYAKRAVAIADTPDTLDTLGWITAAAGNYPQAIAELSRAVRLDPAQSLPMYHLGEVYRRNSQYLEAGDVLARALETARAQENVGLEKTISTAIEKTQRQESAP